MLSKNEIASKEECLDRIESLLETASSTEFVIFEGWWVPKSRPSCFNRLVLSPRVYHRGSVSMHYDRVCRKFEEGFPEEKIRFSVYILSKDEVKGMP